MVGAAPARQDCGDGGGGGISATGGPPAVVDAGAAAEVDAGASLGATVRQFDTWLPIALE